MGMYVYKVVLGTYCEYHMLHVITGIYIDVAMDTVTVTMTT